MVKAPVTEHKVLAIDSEERRPLDSDAGRVLEAAVLGPRTQKLLGELRELETKPAGAPDHEKPRRRGAVLRRDVGRVRPRARGAVVVAGHALVGRRAARRAAAAAAHTARG